MQLTQRQTKNFWNKVEKTDSCWNWVGSTNQGYGRINMNGKVYLAHKIALILDGHELEPSKQGLGASEYVVMHLCDNRKCVNPSHLRIATQKENMKDAKNKGRKWCGEQKGEGNCKAKLTHRKVAALKTLVALGRNIHVPSIAYSLGVDRSQVYNIIKNKSWTHVKHHLAI